MTKRRVVVTGIGAVTPLGMTFVDTWKAVLSNKSGILPLKKALENMGLKHGRLDKDMERTQRMPCQVAATVANFEREGNRTSRFAKMAHSAAEQALEHAGLIEWLGEQPKSRREQIKDQNCPSPDLAIFAQRRQRTGVSIGSGMSGVRAIADMTRTVDECGLRLMKPYFIPKVLTNSAASRVSIQFRLGGPNLTASTACAASAHAIGDAARCIQHDMADIMLAGGTESCIDPLSMGGFTKMRALSSAYNEQSDKASRPFDRDRDGFVMAEGACVLVLEELQHALKRLHGADQLVELVGYGCTGDGHHVTAPDPHGRGAIRAMQMAVKEAEIEPTDVQYVNAHATSTPMGDEIEALAIHQALCSSGEDASSSSSTDEQQQQQQQQTPLYVSSTKGATGHLLGAAGALEAAFTVQSLQDQCIPHTKNLERVQAEIANLPGLSYVQGEPIQCEDGLNVAMSNSFGFGGTNASLLFERIKLEE